MTREGPKENFWIKSCEGYIFIFINTRIEKQFLKNWFLKKDLIHSLASSKGLCKGRNGFWRHLVLGENTTSIAFWFSCCFLALWARFFRVETESSRILLVFVPDVGSSFWPFVCSTVFCRAGPFFSLVKQWLLFHPHFPFRSLSVAGDLGFFHRDLGS